MLLSLGGYFKPAMCRPDRPFLRLFDCYQMPLAGSYSARCGAAKLDSGEATLPLDTMKREGSSMSVLLEQAVAKARSLPDQEQDVIGALILAEIEDDQRWEDAFARSPEKLQALLARAKEQVQAGQCRTAGFDEE